MFETVKNRRTIRKYLPKRYRPDLLNDLLETSFRASTMGGMQLYSVIVTRDTEMKEKLSPAHFNQPMVKMAPVVLTFVPISVVFVSGANNETLYRAMTI